MVWQYFFEKNEKGLKWREFRYVIPAKAGISAKGGQVAGMTMKKRGGVGKRGGEIEVGILVRCYILVTSIIYNSRLDVLRDIDNIQNIHNWGNRGYWVYIFLVQEER